MIGINRRASDYSPARSFPLECLPLLVEMRLGNLISLQHQPSATERSLLQQLALFDAGSGFADFLDAANTIAQLDMVISVDTALAHLAAAMGKPTLLLLADPVAPMWHNRAAMHPLYPTLKLLTKPAHQSWPIFFSQAAPSLRAQVEQLSALARTATLNQAPAKLNYSRLSSTH